MTSIDQDTLSLLPGETPLEKYVALQKILKICNDITYPGRGSKEESMTLIDFSEELSKILPYPT